MASYIIQDRDSGFLYGDSRDLNGRLFIGTPVEFAAALDAAIGADAGPGLVWEYSETHRTDAHATYNVWRLDVDGSEAVPVVHDGQSGEEIGAVERDCRYEVALIRRAVLQSDALGD